MRKCENITNEEYANMHDVVWIFAYCSNQQTVGRYEEMKLFKRYVNDLIYTVLRDPDEYLKFKKFRTQQPAIYLRKN